MSLCFLKNKERTAPRHPLDFVTAVCDLGMWQPSCEDVGNQPKGKMDLVWWTEEM